MTQRTWSCTSELWLKLNCRMKARGPNFSHNSLSVYNSFIHDLAITNDLALIVYICTLLYFRKKQPSPSEINKTIIMHNTMYIRFSRPWIDFWKIHWLMGISFRIFTWMNLFWLQSGSSKQQWLCITHWTIFRLK